MVWMSIISTVRGRLLGSGEGLGSSGWISTITTLLWLVHHTRPHSPRRASRVLEARRSLMTTRSGAVTLADATVTSKSLILLGILGSGARAERRAFTGIIPKPLELAD